MGSVIVSNESKVSFDIVVCFLQMAKIVNGFDKRAGFRPARWHMN